MLYSAVIYTIKNVAYTLYINIVSKKSISKTFSKIHYIG